MEKCSHGIETDSYILTECGYCVPCDVEIHSHETLQAHTGHALISLKEFNEGGCNLPPLTDLVQYKVGASHLNGQEIKNIDGTHARLVESMTKEEIMAAINDVARIIEEKRNLQKHLLIGKHKLELTIEGDLVNRASSEKRIRPSTASRISKQDRARASAAALLGMTVEELEAAQREGTL